MTNYSSGHAAEQQAAEYLQTLGYKIRSTNWRTKYCEIDIIAEKNKVIHFIEVKLRSSSEQGSGFDYITPKKLSQMKFAAEFWVSQNDWHGDYTLSAVSIDEGAYEIIEDLL